MKNPYSSLGYAVYVFYIIIRVDVCPACLCQFVLACTAFETRCPVASPWSFFIPRIMGDFVGGHAQQAWVKNQHERLTILQKNNAHTTLAKLKRSRSTIMFSFGVLRLCAWCRHKDDDDDCACGWRVTSLMLTVDTNMEVSYGSPPPPSSSSSSWSWQ